VLLAFVDVLGPSVREVVPGAPGPITVVPAFLSSGYHVRTDVPRQVSATSRRDIPSVPRSARTHCWSAQWPTGCARRAGAMATPWCWLRQARQTPVR
jgi:hypothetical protein